MSFIPDPSKFGAHRSRARILRFLPLCRDWLRDQVAFAMNGRGFGLRLDHNIEVIFQEKLPGEMLAVVYAERRRIGGIVQEAAAAKEFERDMEEPE